ncbi:MAG: hypothetical protein Q9224_006337, partial [Gallowayella concinna]
MIASSLANRAILVSTGSLLRQSMASVPRLVVDPTQRVAMIARAPVTETRRARSVMSPVKFSAIILAVGNAAMSHACPASRIARGPVLTGNVKCRAQFLVTDCRARSDVPSFSHADTSVLQYVVCGNEGIRPSMVDYYEALTYAEIDLDADPCLFPSCGHVITRENLDQHMDMKAFYEYGSDDSGGTVITAAKDTSQPFSIIVRKSCPACRAPIRNIHRYGRIARRAWIDEATKKFIIWANAGFVPIAARMREVEDQFSSQTADTRDHNILAQTLKAHFMTVARLSLQGSSDDQIRRIANLTKQDKRFKDALRLRTKINVFLAQVNEKEQPFSRIFDLVQDAKRHKGVEGTMKWTPDVLQPRNRLLATVLLLRCEYAIAANFLSVCKGTAAAITVGFQDFQKVCERLIEDAHFRKQPANEVEGHLFWARFIALQRSMSDTVPDGSPPLLTAREHLQAARELCDKYQGSTAGMLAEVEDVEKALRDSTFYTSVTNDEKAAVYAAMASDFRGTGH